MAILANTLYVCFLCAKCSGSAVIMAEDEGRQAFLNLAGEDGEIDAYELQDILNKVFIQGNLFAVFGEYRLK